MSGFGNLICPSILGFCVPIFEIKKHKKSFYHFVVFIDSYKDVKIRTSDFVTSIPFVF